MRKVLGLLLIVGLVLLTGCGGSSGPNESEVAELLGQQDSSISGISCAKTEGSAFVCSASAGGTQTVTFDATVAQDGESVVVTKCDEGNDIYDVCGGLR